MAKAEREKGKTPCSAARSKLPRDRGDGGGDTRTVVVDRPHRASPQADGDDLIIASCARKLASNQAYLRSLEEETQGLLVSRILAQQRGHQPASTVKLPKHEYEKLLYYKQQCLELAEENQQLKVKYDQMIAFS